MSTCAFKIDFVNQLGKTERFECIQKSLKGKDFCLFHDIDYLKDDNNHENKAKVKGELNDRIDKCIANDESLCCIGYYLPDIEIKQEFKQAVWFSHCKFKIADFSGTTFKEAYFHDATFSAEANFHDATFLCSSEADFRSASFSAEADFKHVEFQGTADCNHATFSRRAYFHDATFSDEANFHLVIFLGEANFHDATFLCSSKADFHRASFSAEADFRDTTFSGEAIFSYAKFSNNRSLA